MLEDIWFQIILQVGCTWQMQLFLQGKENYSILGRISHLAKEYVILRYLQSTYR